MLSVPVKIGAAFVTAFLLVGVISVVSYRSLNDSLEAARLVGHTLQVLAKLQTTASHLMGAESGTRGYFMTRQDRYLGPYEGAVSALPSVLRDLRHLTADHPEQQERLDSLERLTAERLGLLAKTIAIAKSPKPFAPRVVERATELTEEICKVVATMEAVEERLMVERVAAAEASAGRAIATILVSNVVVLLLLGLAAFVIFRELKARTLAQKLLRASEEKYRLLFQRNPLPFWLIDTKSQAFLDVNEAAVRHYGYSRDEWLALKVRDIRPAEDIPTFEAKYAREHAPEQRPGPHQYGISRHRRKDGTVILVEITFEDVLLDGRSVHFCLGNDVTERVRAEESLRREKEFAESLIETAPAIVMLVNPEGRMLRVNSYLAELAGRRRQELEGQDWFAIFLPGRDRARMRELHRQFVTTVPLPEPAQGFTNQIVTKDGREREIRWFGKMLKDEQGSLQAILCIGHDITELKQAQERALQAERLAAIGEMVTGLAHESRNALQRSQACLKLLTWEVPDRPKALELVDRLQRALDHLHHLYEEVRRYAAPLRIEAECCDLGELARETWAHLHAAREGRQTELRLAPATADWRCRVDRLGMQQVLRNVFENALQATPDPVVVEVHGSETTLNGRPALRLAIRDNGPGLTADQRKMIFEPFFTTKTHGTGLGMAIAKRIIEAHHGEIAVGANNRPGAELLITLPTEQP